MQIINPSRIIVSMPGLGPVVDAVNLQVVTEGATHDPVHPVAAVTVAPFGQRQDEIDVDLSALLPLMPDGVACDLYVQAVNAGVAGNWRKADDVIVKAAVPTIADVNVIQ